MITFLTWDTAIIASLALLTAYSLLIRKHKALATLVSVYIGYMMASTWGDQVAAFFAGDRVAFSQLWIKVSASPFVVQSLLMIVVTFLVSTFVKLGGKRSRYSALEVVVYAVATLALLVMFLVSFMPIELREQVLKSSQIVPFIFKYREWILGLPVIAIVFFGIYGEEE
ncbi:MAG: hypothetical protein K0S20_62 [Patescibacteria group bacterium]|jgi:hypothetical protein|nr:hypothetical protein [Patescibacteria group bacterium]